MIRIVGNLSNRSINDGISGARAIRTCGDSVTLAPPRLANRSIIAAEAELPHHGAAEMAHEVNQAADAVVIVAIRSREID
jgi:hypothetical protein